MTLINNVSNVAVFARSTTESPPVRVRSSSTDDISSVNGGRISTDYDGYPQVCVGWALALT